jgi:hypothetical protein
MAVMQVQVWPIKCVVYQGINSWFHPEIKIKSTKKLINIGEFLVMKQN